jgi:hypothetical protein
MLTGWKQHQLARNFTAGTIRGRESLVRRFVDHTGHFPWDWTVGDADEFFAHERSIQNLAFATIRAYQTHLKVFSDFLTDPFYEWDGICSQGFGHPSSAPERGCFVPLFASVFSQAASLGTGQAGHKASPSCRRSYPCAVVASCSSAAAIVVLAASAAAFICAPVFGMFDVPIVANVQLAQQGLDHCSLRFNRSCSVPLMMACT